MPAMTARWLARTWCCMSRSALSPFLTRITSTTCWCSCSDSPARPGRRRPHGHRRAAAVRRGPGGLFHPLQRLAYSWSHSVAGVSVDRLGTLVACWTPGALVGDALGLCLGARLPLARFRRLPLGLVMMTGLSRSPPRSSAADRAVPAPMAPGRFTYVPGSRAGAHPRSCACSKYEGSASTRWSGSPRSSVRVPASAWH